MRALHWLAGVAASAAMAAAAGGVDDLKAAFEAREFAGSDGGKLLFRLLRPKGYDTNKVYPLVLFLHGAGGRGADNWGQIKDQPAALLALTPRPAPDRCDVLTFYRMLERRGAGPRLRSAGGPQRGGHRRPNRRAKAALMPVGPRRTARRSHILKNVGTWQRRGDGTE